MMKFLFTLLALPSLQAFPIEINGNFYVEVEPQDSFESVVSSVYQHFLSERGGGEEGFRVVFAVSDSKVKAKAVAASKTRNYDENISAQDKDDIRYILRTLANNSLLKIGGSSSALKSAGDRIDRIHPLRFLQVVFSDEELKVCIANIQGRSWVWSEFLSGITGSLDDEAAHGNLKNQHIKDFAKNIKIKPEMITPYVEAEQWEELVTTLISNVPRTKNPNKFDM